MAETTDIKALSYDDLESLVLERGHKKYRAEQLFRWIHEKHARDFDEMSNVPADLKDPAHYAMGGLKKLGVLSSVDGTRKFIFETESGLKIESVVIPMGGGRLTQCVSSQVGCKMACDFCATAEMPKRQNLSVSEIIDQIYHVQRALGPTGEKVTNLVYMGMGEPLDNFNNVVTSLNLLIHNKGAAIGQRRITVSTVGLVPRIAKFGEAVSVNLAVSLNATTNEQRDKLMPVNRAHNIEKLLQALKDYPLGPRRRIYIEYVMLGGINDTDEDAKRLPRLLQGVDAKVNLIPFNPYPGSRYESTTPEQIQKFRAELSSFRIQANVREPKGRDIQAACGMLDATQPL